MREFDVVRVVTLRVLERPIDGTPGMTRQPAVGDRGTIVHVSSPDRAFIVESVGADGNTVWLADFFADELEVISETQTPR